MASASAEDNKGQGGAGPPRRPPELQDMLNRWLYHPLAARLAGLLRPTFVSPDAVSIAGGLLIWAAAWAYLALPWPQAVGLGLLLHMAWHVVDGADGDLARLRGISSPRGEVIDGICDYLGHIGLYVALAATLSASLGGWAYLLALAAGLSRIAQANHGESQRRAYLWWVYGVPWLKQARAGEERLRDASGRRQGGFALIAREYLRLTDALTPHIARIDAAIGERAGARAVARLARVALRRSLRLQKLLGPNPRTLLLGASMAAGNPLWFFLTEAVLLNLVLLVSLAHHKAAGARLARALN